MVEEDLSDEQKAIMEEQLESLEDRKSDVETFGEYPQEKKGENLFSFFWRIVKKEDSTKISNLDRAELGNLSLNVRGLKNMSLLSGKFNHNTLSGFFNAQAEITLATSASKGGWLVENAISQKKFVARTGITASQPSQKEPEEKWKVFQKKRAQEE